MPGTKLGTTSMSTTYSWYNTHFYRQMRRSIALQYNWFVDIQRNVIHGEPRIIGRRTAWLVLRPLLTHYRNNHRDTKSQVESRSCGAMGLRFIYCAKNTQTEKHSLITTMDLRAWKFRYLTPPQQVQRHVKQVKASAASVIFTANFAIDLNVAWIAATGSEHTLH